MRIQVDRSHYRFSEYTDIPRWISYYFQIREALEEGCRTFLIIGKGDGIVPAVIEQFLKQEDIEQNVCRREYAVHTFDYDKQLNPAYTGDVREIKKILGNRKYDCIIACQILEHVEWRYFERIMKQLSTVCDKKCILSLPVCKISASVWIDLPKIHNNYFNIVIPKFWKRQFRFDGEHHWETGIHGHGKKDIIRICRRYFEVVNNYHPLINPYHWFVIMRPGQNL